MTPKWFCESCCQIKSNGKEPARLSVENITKEPCSECGEAASVFMFVSASQVIEYSPLEYRAQGDIWEAKSL
jgi:hypothetical protein